MVRDNFKNPAHGVAHLEYCVNFRFHFFLYGGVDASQRRIQVCAHRLNLLPSGWFFQTHMPHLNRVTRDLRAEFAQKQFCKGARRHACRGFAGGGSLQNIARIVVVEFLRPRKIGMAGARCHELAHARIFFRGLHRQHLLPIDPVAIFNPQGNGRPNSLPVANSGKHIGSVLFDLLPPAASITKLAAAQLVIDKLHVNGELRGQPGNKRQQRLTVRLTRGEKAKHADSFPRTNSRAMDSKTTAKQTV